MRKRLMLCGLALVGCSQTELPTNPEGPDLEVAASTEVGAIVAAGEATTALGAVATRRLNFQVTVLPTGTVTGGYYVKRSDTGAWFRGQATCMTIVGDTAWVGGITTETNVPNLVRVQTVSYFYAIDRGNGTPPDLISAVRLNDVAGQDSAFCRDRPVVLGFNPLLRGNLVVP